MKSRRKGRNGELEAARVLEELGFEVKVFSPLQARRGEKQKDPDVRAWTRSVSVAVEVKRPKRLTSLLYDALEQARVTAKGEDVPVVMVRADRRSWLVVMDVKTFARLVEGS